MIQLSLEATSSDSTIIDVTCNYSILHCLQTRVWGVEENSISLCHIYTTHNNATPHPATNLTQNISRTGNSTHKTCTCCG